MARPVLGIDLGHGETAVFIRIGSRIFALRLDAAGSLKMITALAVIRSVAGRETVLIGNALRGYETLRKLNEADVQAVSGADFRALMLEYTTVQHRADPENHVLYIPCEEQDLAEDVRAALHSTVDACSPEDVHFTFEKGEYFSPLYQTFKAPPRTKENGFCAVTWDSVSNNDGVYKRTMGDLMALFLKTLSERLIAYNPEEWAETQEGVDVHIGVPALREWLAEEALQAYAGMAAQTLAEWIRLPPVELPATDEQKQQYGICYIQNTDEDALRKHVSIYPEPCAALMAYFREYPDSRLQDGCAVSDHGSSSLDYCGIAVKDGQLCRITGSTDRCGGRMIEDGMLRQLIDREGLSILRDLRPGEASALRLHLRMLKESYYADPDAMGDLIQRLRIHLKDGTVRTAEFTVRDIVGNVVRPGTPWHTAVSSFAGNMASAMGNQGLSSDSLFLTGGTANVTETQEIFGAAGLGECRLSGDTSASVADGLCRMITRTELDELCREATSELDAEYNKAHDDLVDDIHDALYAELPSIVTDVTQKYLQKNKTTHLRHFSFDVEERLRRNLLLMGRLQASVAGYAMARENRLDPIVTALAEKRFPGRLPESPQLEIDYGSLVPDAGRQIARSFVHRINFYSMLGSILHGILALFGQEDKNPKLGRPELERIGRNMRKSSVSGQIRTAVTQALTDTNLCANVDARVLDAMIGYLTLTRFDADVQL